LNHADGVLYASFNPDGTKVATASEDFTARVWQIPEGRPEIAPVHHQEKVQTASFNPDGNWFVTSSVDKTSRVWSAVDGYPLTPPLRQFTSLTNAFFAANGQEIVTIDVNNQTRIWKMPGDDRPVADLVDLARLLAGSSITPTGKSASSNSLETQWRGLRSKYPETFGTSPSEIERWHEAQTEECETNHQWFAAAFHLNFLATLHPRDEAIVRRITDANQGLKNHH
jgi:dipeptidyl aminopeptidase/acylaminoacyl peptidase